MRHLTARENEAHFGGPLAGRDRSAVIECLQASAGWLAATRTGKLSPGFNTEQRAILRKTARLLETGVRRELGRAKSTLGPDDARLSELDRSIVSHLAAGCSYKIAAKRLRLGYGRVHTRIKVLYKRFGVHSKVALIELFRELDW